MAVAVLSPSRQEVRASTPQTAPCSAGTYIHLFQANSAWNIIQCFPAIIGNTVQSSNDYTGVILSRNNTIHYEDTYFTFKAKAKLATCFSCTYLSKKKWTTADLHISSVYREQQHNAHPINNKKWHIYLWWLAFDWQPDLPWHLNKISIKRKYLWDLQKQR